MKTSMLTRVIIAALFAGVVAIGCGDNDGGIRENQAPIAQLTAGPVEGDTLNYQVRLFWTGSDNDGFVAGYRVAVDPPAAFSEDDIAGGAIGIEETLFPGANGAPDTTRVSKYVGAAFVYFDWIHTEVCNRLFRFSATRSESLDAELGLQPTGRFLGMHAVYVRAVDDDGARSLPARVAFTAETVAPTSKIERPALLPNTTNLIVASSFRLQWSGSDPDREPQAGAPIRFEYALVEPAQVVCLTFDCGRARDLVELRKAQWVPLPPDSTEIRITPPWNYAVLGLRAVDEAGAVEPFLDFGRNVLRVVVRPGAGVPQLTLKCEAGTWEFLGTDQTAEVEALQGLPLNFVVHATAESYGETVTGWRWGADLADYESERGWSAWTTYPALPPITFTHGGIHTLAVEARDGGGGLTRGLLILNLADAPMDRAVLLVDDSRDLVTPNDAQHDAFWNSLFQDSGRFNVAGDVFTHAAHGANDTYNQYPVAPTLAELGRYRTIVWNCWGDGYNGQTAVFLDASMSQRLAFYLRAGGQLWVEGRLTVPPMLGPGRGVTPDFIYPKDITVQPTRFAYRYMKLASSRIQNAKGSPPNDNLVGVKPFPGRAETYPAMEQDSNKISPYKASISHCDAIFDPIYLQDHHTLSGVLDSLYVYQAKKGTGSPYHNKLNAVRWHDPDPAREHGRTQWFGFPLYYMKKDQAQETFNRSVDWFREEVRP